MLLVSDRLLLICLSVCPNTRLFTLSSFAPPTMLHFCLAKSARAHKTQIEQSHKIKTFNYIYFGGTKFIALGIICVHHSECHKMLDTALDVESLPAKLGCAYSILTTGHECLAQRVEPLRL